MDGRPPEGPPRLTERQREAARLVADGLSNPEISARLGITLDGAKYLVSEVLARLGVQRREEVAAWYRRQRRSRRLPVFAWLWSVRQVLGLSALGFGLAVAGAVAVQFASGSAGATGRLGTGYTAYTPGDLVAAGFVDGGALFDVSTSGPAAVSSVRAGFTVVRLAGAAVVDFTGAWSHAEPPTGAWNSPYAFPAASAVGGREFYATVSVVNKDGYGGTAAGPSPTRWMATGNQRIRITSATGRPTLLIEMVDAQLRPHRSVVAANGHLFVDPVPLPASAVVAYDTGERIDVARMRAFPYAMLDHPQTRPPSAVFTNWCGRGPACESTIGFGLPTAPFAGTLTCAPPDRAFTGAPHLLDLTGDGITLEFSPIGGGVDPCDLAPRRVSAGERVSNVGAWWVARARKTNGRPISVVGSPSGTMFIGQTRQSLQCPVCIAGQ